MGEKETRLAEAIVDGLGEVPPIEALNALCIATGGFVSRIERLTGGNILQQALSLVIAVKAAMDKADE